MRNLGRSVSAFGLVLSVALCSCSKETSKPVNDAPNEADAVVAVEIGKRFDFKMVLQKNEGNMFDASRSFLFTVDEPVELFLQKGSSCQGVGEFNTFELLSTQSGEALKSTDEMEGFENVGMYFPGNLEKGDYVLTAVAYADHSCTVMSTFLLEESKSGF